jgi:receptor protein-tyrosine kinase
MNSDAFSTLTPAQTDVPTAERIGERLLRAGTLGEADLARIVAHQREHGVRFGEAARALGLLTDVDLDGALAEQFGYPWKPGSGPTDPQLFALAEPFGARAETLRALRLRLHLAGVGRADTYPTLAILSPQDGDGRSTLAANLAVSFAELGLRTLLVDADLRRPRQHTLFGATSADGLSSVLAGRSASPLLRPVPGFAGLAVLPCGPVPPNTTELLARPALHAFLAEARTQFDLVLLDTPPAGPASDAFYVASAAGAALLVARRNYTGLRSLEALTEALRATAVPTLGVVFNSAR